MIASYDLAFAHAVQQAATGLRTASGIDPEIEAAPLAAMLRSDRALDVDGLELLARLVTGDLRAPYGGKSPKGESMLALAVRRAGKAWRRGKGADPATAGARLAASLRGDVARLGAGERALLADLVVGELRRGQHAPPQGAGVGNVEAIARSFESRLAAGLERKNALSDTASEFRVSESTVVRYAKLIEDRKAMIRKATDI